QDGEKSNPLTSLLPFILILVVIYFFMIRPQSKKAKEQKNFKSLIKKGDKIITIGGIYGKILEIRDNDFIIEVGNGIKLTIQKEAVSMEASRALNPDK
ncbi:preprotein translocase subunit YajC, partial [Bacteroidota bacterium]